MKTVFVDGAMGEGGGQVLRTSLALSCITGRPLHIENIRAARRNPGLAKQHLSAVQAACRICGGKADGVDLGSKVLDFQPGDVGSGDFCFDIGSAGSASLVIQTVLPALFLADKASMVTVTGGTHNPLAPPFDFLCETFLPAVAAAGFVGDCSLLRHGFYPAGGGKMTVDVQPQRRGANQLIEMCEPAGRFEISARIYTAHLPEHIAQRQEKLLAQSPLDIRDVEHIEVTDSDGPGNAVCIYLCCSERTTVFIAFGVRGKPSQKVVGEVVGSTKQFIDSGAAVDKFLADQLLIYMAVTKSGTYTTNEVSTHLKTNIDVIKKFLPVDFIVEQRKALFRVSCQPI